MIYQCTNCKHIFEEGEEYTWQETHGLDSPPYEKFAGCPICHEAFNVIEPCERCDSCTGETLYSGICSKCLEYAINYETALAYITYCDELPLFMFSQVWESSVPERVSDKLMSILKVNFIANETEDVLREKTNFLDLCKKFILDGDKDYFANWLKKEVK